MDARSRLETLMAERILVLEGPKGTAIQTLELSEEDFRGELLKDHPKDVRGDNDLLGLTRPDIVEAIHRDYVAGRRLDREHQHVQREPRLPVRLRP